MTFWSKTSEKKLTNRITGKVKTKAICILIQKAVKPTITSNHYSGVKQDELVQYGDYNQPWKLDSGTSGHFCGKQTRVRYRRKKKVGINVHVADGKTMAQVKEGSAMLQFPNIPNPLMIAGKIVKIGHTIILDDPIVTVINKATHEVDTEGVFDDRTSTWNIYLDGPGDYEFKNE